MQAEVWALLLTIGIFAVVLAQALRRMERRLAEMLEMQQRSALRIVELETEVKRVKDNAK